MTQRLDNSWKWEMPQNEVMPIHAAIKDQTPDVLEYLKSCSDLDLKDNYDNTPLHVAVEEDKPDWIEALLAAGASHEITNREGETPLALATRIGKKECIEAFDVGQALSESQVLFNSWVEIPKYPLHEAIKNNSPNHTVLVGNMAHVNHPDDHGYTPLHTAVKANNLQWVKWLLSADANLEARDLKGRTALHHAAKKEIRKGILEFLLPNGAEMNAEDDERKTPLDLAHEYKAWNNAVCLNGAAPAQVLALFPESDEAGNTLLHNAILAMDEPIDPVGDSDWTELKNEKNYEGNTPLHLACQHSKMDWIRALVEAKADINVQNNNGDAPIHVAAAIPNNQTIIELLANNGAKSLKNDADLDPFFVALEAKAESNFERLLQLDT